MFIIMLFCFGNWRMIFCFQLYLVVVKFISYLFTIKPKAISSQPTAFND